MAVLPESMDKLNTDDTRGSLTIIENYIRYMGERVEFAMRNMTKNVSAAGVSSVETYILLTALQNELATLKSTVNDLNGTVTGLGTQVSGLSGSIQTMQESIASVNESVSALDGRIASLEQRVAALETTTT